MAIDTSTLLLSTLNISSNIYYQDLLRYKKTEVLNMHNAATDRK